VAAHAEGKFEVTSWSEEQAEGLEDTAKVTKATFGQRFSGGIEADTVADTVMTYRPDGTADYVGFQRVSGRLDGRRGSFVFQAVGGFDGQVARADITVVPGSGTDELAGLRGTGTVAVPMGMSGTYSLDYELD
jgi:Protein of unknown function (DUF3224)